VLGLNYVKKAVFDLFDISDASAFLGCVADAF
jgi:hypothetical protein